MYRIKKWTVLLLALLLAFQVVSVQAESEIIDENEISDEIVKYETVEAVYGDITYAGKYLTMTYLPKNTRVLNTGVTAMYAECLVSYGQSVTVGDPLFRIVVEKNEIDVKDKKLKLERLKDDQQTEQNLRLKEIEKLNSELAASYDPFEQRKLMIRIRMAEVDLEQYLYTSNSQIEQLKEEIRSLKEANSEEFLYAPASGTIADIVHFNQGEMIYSGMEICTIRDRDVLLLLCGYEDGMDVSALRYGMEVEVTSRYESYTNIYKGRVIVSPDSVKNSGYKGAIVEIEGYDPNGDDPYKNVTIVAETMDLKNVLIIPNNARTSQNGKFYVQVLDDNNVVHTREILIGASNREYSWVLSGLSEGDRVIVK